MEKFKLVLKQRLNLMFAMNGLILAFIALTGMYGTMATQGNQHFADMIHGFQVGIFVGLQLLMIIGIMKYQKALKDETSLKKIYIEENDERRRLIKSKISGTSFDFSLGAIATATVVAGFFHHLIFVTLFAVLAFMCLLKGALKLYYKNKI